MAFDEALAGRVRRLLADTPQVCEKRMFGGLAFLVQGHMSLGVHGAELIVRLHHADSHAALAEPGARIFDLSGRPMKGWLLVAGDALREKRLLARWVKRAVAYAQTLPKK